MSMVISEDGVLLPYSQLIVCSDVCLPTMVEEGREEKTRGTASLLLGKGQIFKGASRHLEVMQGGHSGKAPEGRSDAGARARA